MMKRLLSSALALMMVLSLIACGQKQAATSADSSAPASKKETFELALVTDLGTIDDKSFNQGAWEGLVKYATEKGISHKYYQPQEAGTNAYFETIELAIEGGAKLVVCPGFLFEEPVYLAQTKYPDVHFILLDGEPHTADYSTYKTENNVMPILYQEDEAGFLAGYAAVKDGNTKLGFLGGMSVPAVIRFGFGYIQGIDAAAKELGVNCEVVYNYTGAFAATPEAQALAASWYNAGTEVVFGCGGAVGNSAMSAAEGKNQQEGKFVAKVIGVDVDQYSESDTVITSAMKQLSNSVYDGISMFYNGNFPGGKTSIFSVKNDGVGAAMDHAKFETFSKADYNAVYEDLKAGKYAIFNDVSDYNPETALKELSNTKVKFIE
ncbi:MAG: BMP family ABC transporter substrate-binding protein [Lachnospiraceae bacterium]|nr:BMP family ABC transporter substrate-binding protein [Lachnospiraceae bacterium]